MFLISGTQKACFSQSGDVELKIFSPVMGPHAWWCIYIFHYNSLCKLFCKLFWKRKRDIFKHMYNILQHIYMKRFTIFSRLVPPSSVMQKVLPNYCFWVEHLQNILSLPHEYVGIAIKRKKKVRKMYQHVSNLKFWRISA